MRRCISMNVYRRSSLPVITLGTPRRLVSQISSETERIAALEADYAAKIEALKEEMKADYAAKIKADREDFEADRVKMKAALEAKEAALEASDRANRAKQKVLLDSLVVTLSNEKLKATRDGFSVNVATVTGRALCKCAFEANAMHATFTFPNVVLSEIVTKAANQLKHVNHVEGSTYRFEWDDAEWNGFVEDLQNLLNQCWFDPSDASKSAFELLKYNQPKDPPVSQFPAGMYTSVKAIRPQLRPFPSFLIPVPDSDVVLTNKFGNPVATGLSDSVRTPILFHDGVSGKGKTITATTISDETLRRVGGDSFKDAPVLGYYHCCSTANSLEDVAQRAGEHFVCMYEEGCPSPTSFGPVILHVVLDELGSRRDWVRTLVEKGRLEAKPSEVEAYKTQKQPNPVSEIDFAGEIRKQLDTWFKNKNASAGGGQRDSEISVILSLVGTGIERTNSPDSSLPPQYLVCTLKNNLSHSILAHHMLLQGRPTALWLTEPLAKDIAALLSKDHLFGAIMSNARCAVFAGEEAGMALRFFRGSKEFFELTIDEVFPYLVGHSESILIRASMRYFRENQWSNLESSERETLVTSVISLLITQPYGFHLLSDTTIEALCCKVGAIEDTLQFTSTSTHYPEHRLTHRALSAGAFPCVPTTKTPNPTAFYPQIGAHRFVIPPAIAVAVLMEAVSIHFNGVLFGGTRQLASLTGENVASTVIWCALEAVRHFSKVEEGPKQVPALLAFPSLADHFPLEGADVAKEQVMLAMHKAQIELLPPQSNTKVKARLDNVANSLKRCGMVLEMAGPGSSRNDLTLHNPGGASIAFEFKSYTDSTSVPLPTLEKRCFQMGFNTLQCKSGINSFVKDVRSHKSASNLMGRYITLKADNCPRKKTNEYLVLCGPRGWHLLPDGVSISFRDRVESTLQKPSPGRCKVVCMTLGIEQLVHQCSSRHKVVAATNTEQPANNECYEGGVETENGDITLKSFTRRNRYVPYPKKGFPHSR